MKPQSTVGIVLVVIGIIALGYQGFTYTTREKAIDLGPIQVTTERTHTFPLPPIVGGVALIGGILLLMMAGKKA